MARGESFEVGFERIAQNGYHYIKQPPGTKPAWKLRHHLIAEERLGRPINSKFETVCFKDRNRHNFDPENIVVEPRKGMDTATKIGLLSAQKAQIEADLAELLEEVS